MIYTYISLLHEPIIYILIDSTEKVKKKLIIHKVDIA